MIGRGPFVVPGVSEGDPTFVEARGCSLRVLPAATCAASWGRSGLIQVVRTRRAVETKLSLFYIANQ